MTPNGIEYHGEEAGDWTDASIFDRKVSLAFGKNREDKNFSNVTGTIGDFIDAHMDFRIGRKDGTCVLQGTLVSGRRLAKNVVANSILMLDIDTGLSTEAIVASVKKAGLFALVWTTYSHMTDVSTIAETKLVQWVKKNGDANGLGHDNADIEKAAYQYLRHDRRYDPSIVDPSVRLDGRELEEGGVVYKIQHKPMPKHRILFVLKEPFSFTEGGTQNDRINRWKECYSGVSDALGLPYDSSCVDPSRLMYLPRVGDREAVERGKIIAINGACLDIEAFRGVLADDDVTSRFTNADKSVAKGDKSGSLQTVTLGLMKFVASHHDFDAAAWAANIAPEDVRPGTPTSPGINFACPNEDSHTKASPDDTAFVVFADGESWGMHCQHDGCRQASGMDRVWYLDQLCVKYGVTDVSDLRAFSASAEALERAQEDARTLGSEPELLQDTIDAVCPTTATKDLDKVLGALASHVDSLFVEASLRKMAKASDGVYTAGILKKRMRDLKKAGLVSHASGGTVDELGIPNPPADLTRSAPIWREWGAKKGMEAVKGQLRRLNDADPFIFTRADGTSARLIETTDRHGTALRVEKLSVPQWAALLNERLHFKRIDRDTERPIDSFAETQIVSDLCYDQNPPWPALRGVSRVPVFAPDGSIRTKRGYDAELCVYVDPQEDWLDVPDVVSEDDVDRAVWLLHELVRDVAFSDAFETAETSSRMTDEIGEDGWPVPNWERGYSSRLHYFASILQTFVRYMIEGSCPAYHIDKHDHGEGGTLLANMVSIIIEGIDATATGLPARDEEVSKTVTTALVEGSPLLLFDNIPAGKVSSPEMAMALTAGAWKARLLGTNINAYVPIMCVWTFIGVNLTFHKELVRRNIPIKINSQTPNPAMRPGSMFKHNPGERFARENRRELVWACCVLVRNWFQQPDKTVPDAIELNSFTEWSRVMNGIFHAAGLSPGFLQTLGTYHRSHNDDGTTSIATLTTLYHHFGMDNFTMGKAIEALKDGFGNLPVDLPVNGQTEHGMATSMGRWFSKDLYGKTFDLTDREGEVVRVTVRRNMVGGLTQYGFGRA